MDQKQLQIARAARWRQTAATDPSAPLRTLDDAAPWIDDIGFCLFLPRHTQLPAPAPSFAEACLGKPSLTPPPDAIAIAAGLLARLIGERRVVPLNLLGAFSEHPDFLVTPEVLPWVVAMRGDRQWKSAPGGRSAPIVLRTFEALDREGELTAVELRERLGHEITEAAALRALIELWTTLRAMPIPAPASPTRWTLLRNRFPAQLATAAGTSQTTALSALLSLYLHSAVAATAEEAEIFLSPLTARSRIREVLHGMMATRQLSSTTVAAQTLLFVEGSLPETAPAEPGPLSAKPEPPASLPSPHPPFRKEPRPTRWELPARETRPDRTRPWQKKPASPARASDKPWQRRENASRSQKFRRPNQPASAEQPSSQPPNHDRPPRRPPWRSGRAAPPSSRAGRPERRDRPWRDRPPRRDDRPAASQAPGQERRTNAPRGEGKFGGKRRFSGPRPPGSAPNRPFRPGKSSSSPSDPRPSDPRPSGPRPPGSAPNRPFRPGKSSSSPSARPSGRGPRPFRPGSPKNKFRKPSPAGRNPRKNRKKEHPE
ncbi:MAG TPA: hypothetical protein VL990_15510 [Acidobacteriaceae bacterium]|nr:hypothetical protein [Acidobacteriaceae bacterium]